VGYDFTGRLPISFLLQLPQESIQRYTITFPVMEKRFTTQYISLSWADFYIKKRTDIYDNSRAGVHG
jgi:hypothetical protein